jgi:hypothetical protein
MCLRFSTGLILGTVLAVSSLTHAKTPEKSTPAPAKTQSPAPSSSAAGGIAQVQAIFSYCESVDPHSAGKYVLLQALILAGNSPAQILADEKSSAFRSEFNSTSAELAAIPVSTGITTCRSAIAGM